MTSTNTIKMFTNKFNNNELCKIIKRIYHNERWRTEHHLKPSLLACTMSEFFCTAFFVFLGTTYNAVDILTNGTLGSTVPIAWGLCLIFTIQIGFRISGCHVNSAVSLFFYFFRELSFVRFIVYSIAQLIGAFIGSLMTYIVYYDLINKYENGERTVIGSHRTAHIFATYPQPYLTIRGGLIDQISTTALLCIMIRSITKRRHGVPLWLQPYLLGLSLTILTIGFATNCQCAINPSRDFGPRLLTWCLGYGWEVFSYNNYQWFWIPILGPYIGAILGGILYKIFIGNFLSDLPEDRNNPKNLELYENQLDTCPEKR